ncbi:MAG: NifU family protein [Chitinophagales bacterium]|nr:NifU family protein [Chitinophagales bacterium]
MDASEKKELIERVERALDSIRPFLKADGGDIEIVDITDNFELQVNMVGNCDACMMKQLTLKGGVEGTVLSAVPEIIKVSAVIPTK